MNSINITGNPVKDAELKTTINDNNILTFTLVNNERYKTKNDEIREEAIFIECNIFGSYAKAMHKHIRKGKMIGVSGKIKYDTWISNDKLHSKHSIIVEKITFLSKKDKESIKEETYELNKNSNDSSIDSIPF